jgi:hypothetical protein
LEIGNWIGKQSARGLRRVISTDLRAYAQERN